VFSNGRRKWTEHTGTCAQETPCCQLTLGNTSNGEGSVKVTRSRYGLPKRIRGEGENNNKDEVGRENKETY